MKKSQLLVILTITLLMVSCVKKGPWKGQEIVLGTVVTISVYDQGSVNNVDNLIDETFTEMQKLDKLWACKGEGSDLALLTDNAGGKSQQISEKTFDLLAQGLQLEQLTDQAFNIRMGPVTDLWGFHTSNPHIPGSDEIDNALAIVDGGMFFAGKSCLLGLAGMKLDVGGIGKGFAVDLAVDRMLNDGVKAGLVEAGGDLRAFGAPRTGEKWRIGVRHPRNPDEFYGIFHIGEWAVATSGDYQQYFEVNGKRYHHIFNPNTGYPSMGCVSATVMAKTCIEADAISTALMVMGAEEGGQWLEENPEYPGLIIYFDEEGNLTHLISPELEDSFSLQ